MNRTSIILRNAVFLLFLAGAVWLASGCTAQALPITGQEQTSLPQMDDLAPAAAAWAQTSPCGGSPACDKLVTIQAGQISRLSSSAQGFQAQQIQPGEVKSSRWLIDTGRASPDGKWAAFTSIGSETGGPVFVQNLETRQWVNLIEAVNSAQTDGQPPLQEDWMWDIIGWFPDSQRLMVAPLDLARVDVIDVATYQHQWFPIQTDGMSGSTIVDLAPDGSGFIYLGTRPDGKVQVLYSYNFASTETTALLSQPYQQGILQFPRYAPDGSAVAYLYQQGHPTSGMSFTIHLYLVKKQTTNELVQGNLGITIPTWSPDGQYIAFTRPETSAQSLAAEEASIEVERSNVWVVNVASEQATQITFVDGQARTPTWAADGKTLAFVTQDGQVGLAAIDQPGTVWQAAGPSVDFPELTSVFFLP